MFASIMPFFCLDWIFIVASNNIGFPSENWFSSQESSGKQSHNYGKSPFFTGKLTISVAIFQESLFVCLPGRVSCNQIVHDKPARMWIICAHCVLCCDPKWRRSFEELRTWDMTGEGRPGMIQPAEVRFCIQQNEGLSRHETTQVWISPRTCLDLNNKKWFGQLDWVAIQIYWLLLFSGGMGSPYLPPEVLISGRGTNESPDSAWWAWSRCSWHPWVLTKKRERLCEWDQHGEYSQQTLA